MVVGRFTTRYAMDDFKDALRELAPAVAGLVVGAIVLATIYAPIVWLKSSQEAAAFNRFTTGPRATTWDALWVELRVEADR
jgi:hypothetical protein